VQGSSRSGDQISAQELALAKALKLRKKFSSGSLGHSLAGKSTTKGGIHGGGGGVPAPSRCE
jgi:hypothetical protein